MDGVPEHTPERSSNCEGGGNDGNGNECGAVKSYFGEIPLLNALRRTIMSSVACAAIDQVVFTQNTTPFWPEMIAHRLGMLPLRNLGANTEGELKLLVRNDIGQPLLVTAESLLCTDFAPMHPNTPLVWMPSGGCLELTAHVRTKCGRVHARFCPALVTLAVDEPAKKDSDITPTGWLTIECHTNATPDKVLADAMDALTDQVRTVMAVF